MQRRLVEAKDAYNKAGAADKVGGALRSPASFVSLHSYAYIKRLHIHTAVLTCFQPAFATVKL